MSQKGRKIKDKDKFGCDLQTLSYSYVEPDWPLSDGECFFLKLVSQFGSAGGFSVQRWLFLFTATTKALFRKEDFLKVTDKTLGLSPRINILSLGLDRFILEVRREMNC